MLYILFFISIFSNPLTESDLSDMSSVEKSIQEAIKNGDAKVLASYFYSTVELNLPDAKGSFSKSQAELLLKNFFNVHKPKDFSVIKEGTSSGEKSKFAVGSYADTDGKKFRVYYLIKEISGNNYISVIKFE